MLTLAKLQIFLDLLPFPPHYLGVENFSYLLEGARLNDPIALLQLSKHYYSGSDMFESNYVQAYIYAKKSADAGNVDGCAMVAYLLDNGKGCYKNPKEAQKYRDKYQVQKKDKE